MILCDTDIIIELLKGNTKIINHIEVLSIGEIAISAITVMELYYGVLNKNELMQIKKSLEPIAKIQINNDISQKAIQLIELYGKSHNLQIPDAIIGATCLVRRFELFTENKRDFKFINGLRLYTPQ